MRTPTHVAQAGTGRKWLSINCGSFGAVTSTSNCHTTSVARLGGPIGVSSAVKHVIKLYLKRGQTRTQNFKEPGGNGYSGGSLRPGPAATRALHQPKGRSQTNAGMWTSSRPSSSTGPISLGLEEA